MSVGFSHESGWPWWGTTLLIALVVTGAGCLSVVDRPASGPERETTNPRPTTNGTVVRVVDVVDGDTVDVRYPDGSTDTVRLLGVDTPEVHVETDPSEFEGVPNTTAGRQCLRSVGANASAFLDRALSDGPVRLVDDPLADDSGEFGRRLRYVYVDGTNLNHRLVARGYARVYDGQFEQSSRFYESEAGAMADERGVWACRSVG